MNQEVLDLIGPPDICFPYHQGNPESRAAFEKIEPKITGLQTHILDLAKTMDAAGITVKDVRAYLDLEHQTASARLTELKKLGKLVPNGLRRDGCAVLVLNMEK